MFHNYIYHHALLPAGSGAVTLEIGDTKVFSTNFYMDMGIRSGKKCIEVQYRNTN